MATHIDGVRRLTVLDHQGEVESSIVVPLSRFIKLLRSMVVGACCMAARRTDTL
jgi:hypothetical protein